MIKDQLSIFSYIKKYISYLKKKNIDTSTSPYCYLHSYGNFPSTAKLKIKFYGIKFFFTGIIYILKNIIQILTLNNYKLYGDKINLSSYKKLFHSIVSKKDFKKDGSYNDSFFNFNSKMLNDTIFFLISVDGYIPKNVDKNIFIFARSNKNYKLSFSFFFLSLFRCLIKNKFSIHKFIHEFNFMSQYSYKINLELNNLIKKNNLIFFFSIYEAQPYQNYLFYSIKKKFKKIKTIGFYHTGLLAVHSSLVYRKGTPDKLLISGNFQKRYLVKYLGWPKKKIKSIVSFRHKIINKKNYQHRIFLPLHINNINSILKYLEYFFYSAKEKSLPIYKIKDHPYAYKSKKNKNLIKKIKILKNKYKFKFNQKIKANNSIFIGPTTSILLALDHKVNAIHISEDSLFDFYNPDIWNCIKIKNIHPNIRLYTYRIDEKILNLQTRYNKIQNYIKL